MSAYAVDKVCWRVNREPLFRQALEEDPEGTLRRVSPPLTEEELRLLLAGDVGTLARMGSNHFLLHQLGRFEVLGLTLPTYAERIRSEYREERARRASPADEG
jgi:Aromatic-ring-opening dioxygenase LigAB, LigA subunit